MVNPKSGLRQWLLDITLTISLSVRDIGLFLSSARADARLNSFRAQTNSPSAAFDRLYAEAPQNDPWVSGSPKYQYQKRKYDALIESLHGKSFNRVLDLGCGIGLLTERLAPQAKEVVGIDISSVALHRARERTKRFENVTYQQGDILSLDSNLNGKFDLIVVADTIYYLPPPIGDDTLKQIALRLSDLLRPDGMLLVVNHYFPIPNAESSLTLRIHRAFHWSPALMPVSKYRRLFFLSSLFTTRCVDPRA